MNSVIHVTRSSMPDLVDYIEEIKDLWDSRWLTNSGIKHTQLEIELKKYLNTPNISLFCNGHLALEYAIEAFQLTGEVITTPFTFASTTHAIIRKGLTPVFCDINEEDYTIQTDHLESLITERTSAIIPVHVYGNICDVEEIERIAKKYNLKVIYDAAHAFGITINGESIANFGDASMFSFHSTKVFHTIEGGALTYKNSTMSTYLNALKNFGITGPENVEYVGGNAKMNEFQASMGLCNLRKLQQEINSRKIVFERYVEQLSDVKGVKLSLPSKNIKSNYAYFPILFDNTSFSRDEVYDLLLKENVYTRKYFYPLTNELTYNNEKITSNCTPVAQKTSENILTLPLYADLHLDDVDRICDVIKTTLTGIKSPIFKGDSPI